MDGKTMVLAGRPDGRMESLLADASRTVFTKGDLRTGREQYQTALRLARDAGDARAVAVAALGLSGIWVHEHRAAGRSAFLESCLRQSLPMLDPRSPLALRVRARLAAESDYRRGEHAAILAALGEARTSADPVARAEAASLAHHCVLGPGQGPLRRELSAELIAESFATPRRSDLLIGLLWQTVDLFLDGDVHAERRLSELRELLAHEDHLAVGFVVSAIDVMLAIRAGRLEEAEDLSGRCLERGMAAGDADAQGWHGAQLVAIRWYQGRLAELLPALEKLAHAPTLSVVDNSFRAALAVAAALAGDRSKAAAALAGLCGSDLARLPRSSSWLVTMGGIAQAAFLLQDRVTAQRVHGLLLPHADLPMIASLGVACFGSAHHALGLASLTFDDADGAVAHFQRAVQHNLALAHLPAVTASRELLARALVLRARPRDAEAARAELAAVEASGVPSPDAGVSVRRRPEATVTLIREGWDWQIEMNGRRAVVKHSIGMFHLAVLIANPRREIAAIDLVAGVAAVSKGTGPAVPPAQLVLDREARQAYRRRLRQLDEEAAGLEARGDTGHAVRLRSERDWLQRELANAAGIGGRSRSFADDGERARISVGKAIRRSLARIADADALTGDYLRRTIHTGMRCSYWPA